MITSNNFKIPLTRENILNRISEYSIFRYYLGFDFKISHMYTSPLRSEKEYDRVPSLNLYVNNRGELRYKDFGHSQGTCFDFVMNLYNLTYSDALQKINIDLCLNLNKSLHSKGLKKLYEKEEYTFFKEASVITYETRSYNKYDKKYWGSYGISISTLQKFNVYPCTRVYLNGNLKMVQVINQPIYAFSLSKDSKVKIYRPFADKRYKFLSTATNFDLQGLEQLELKKQPLLILTKSIKDIMLLYEYGIPAVAQNGESMIIPDSIMNFLHSYFDKIVILYDNDAPGILGASKLSEQINCPFIIPLLGTIYKDPSDYYKALENKDEFNKLINIIKNQNMSKTTIAVYGSLRQGEYNYNAYKSRYGNEIEYIGTTTIKGYNLHSLGAYPAVLKSENSDKNLTIDLLEVSPNVLNSINRMEIGAGYKIENIEVTLNGVTYPALLYIYSKNLSYPIVESGDWVNYLNKN